MRPLVPADGNDLTRERHEVIALIGCYLQAIQKEAGTDPALALEAFSGLTKAVRLSCQTLNSTPSREPALPDSGAI